MYIPALSYDARGVPKLSQNQIDKIAEGFIEDFQPEILMNPAQVNIEEFVECYLGMIPDYQYLSHNGIYLGMTVFNDTDKIPVYDPRTKRAEYISASAHTVIIERTLLENDKQEHRYRFTLGHEAGHDIFHPKYYKFDMGPLSLLNLRIEVPPMVLCRRDSIGGKQKTTRNKTEKDWLEWQANSFSAALLMLRKAVEVVMKATTPKDAVTAIANVFNVSNEAAGYRLRELGYITN